MKRLWLNKGKWNKMINQKNEFELCFNRVIKQIDELNITDSSKTFLIFQIERLLNLSHMNIIELYKSFNLKVESHQAYVDWVTLELIIRKIKDQIDISHLKKIEKELRRCSRWDEEQKKMKQHAKISNDELYYSETLDEYMTYNEINQDHICIDGEWFHEDTIGHDR